MAQLPADRTKLAQAQGNMTPTFTASSQKVKEALTEAYDTIDLLNQKADNHAAATTLPHADKSVTRAKLADKVIGAGQLDDAAVGQSHHQDNGIPSRAIGDNVIIQRHMSDNSVGSAELQAGAVTATKIPNGTINSQHIDAALLASSASLSTQAEFDKRGINVQKHGAKGDWNGTIGTDDTAAIQAAANAVPAGGILLFPYCTGYATSSPITIPVGVSVVMEAPIVYTGTAPVAAFVIGATGQANFRVSLKLNVIRKIQSDWTNENDIGIKIINANTSNIEIVQASNFTIPVQCIGSGTGFAYNRVALGYLSSGKYQLDLTNESSGGYCNENVFLGGRFTCNTGVGSGLNRYGVRIDSRGTAYRNNNNLFVKPSFELDKSTAGAAEAIPVLINYGDQNEFVSCRDEGNSSTFARIMNGSVYNSFDLGFGSNGVIDDQSTTPYTKRTTRKTSLVDAGGRTVFSSGAIYKNACYYDGSTTVNLPNLNITTSTNAIKYNSASGFSITPDYIEITSSRMMGIFIGSKNCKRFIIRRDVEQSNPGRINIQCYDSAGTVLTSAGAKHPYVRGDAGTNFTYNTAYGGYYGTAVDNPQDTYFVVGDDVSYICVMLSNGTVPLRIRSFEIETLDNGYCSAWTGYEEIVKGANIATTPPTVGTWERGRTIYNAAPAASAKIGWVCVAAGTPGTWKAFGAIDV